MIDSASGNVTADAPGRVNLMGEHTDYNEGYVLPTAIPQRTSVHLKSRPDGVVRVSSKIMSPSEATYRLGDEQRRSTWVDYVQGVTQTLRRAGYVFGGFDATIHSEVPVGRGLSSSAALTIALMRAIREASSLLVDDVMLAVLAQRSENELVGAPVGVMDPLACTFGDERTAVFIDTRALRIERIALPENTQIAVIDSGIAHANVNGGYAHRRLECMSASRLLGVTALRDVNDIAQLDTLDEPLRRRARHVVTENARVLSAAAAMRKCDASTLGRLFVESHASMRDDFEVSVPAVNSLVERALREPHVFGARLTGGGFGGAIVILAGAGFAREAAERVARDVCGSAVVVPEAST